eukprot:TRINITY_DN4585_c0_g1_i1.p1 TRINITY_DN4585_c0_g1~~TRINITY_DN4585_c0_g1_i1.p1  ORF type:complete len:927 (+),score=418.30 TRINITY_DN4585_c0_g1_i1:86-2782(+)
MAVAALPEDILGDLDVRTDNGSAVATGWDDEPDAGGDLTNWVADRTAKGSKGIMSLHNHARDVQFAEKRGYVPVPMKKERPRQAGGWDTSTAANATGIPKYDALKDRHCRGIMSSAAYHRNSKKMQYAVEASKAQKKFGHTAALNPLAAPDAAPDLPPRAGGAPAATHPYGAPAAGGRKMWPLNSSVASKRALATLNQKKAKRDTALGALESGPSSHRTWDGSEQGGSGEQNARATSLPPPRGRAEARDVRDAAAAPAAADASPSYPAGSGPPTHRGQLPPPGRKDLDFAPYDDKPSRARRPAHHKKAQSLPPPKHRGRYDPRRAAADGIDDVLRDVVDSAGELAVGDGASGAQTDGNGNIIIHAHHYHQKHTTKTYNTHLVNHYGPPDAGSPVRGGGGEYDEAEALQSLLAAEKQRCAQLQERLNEEMQKKMKSNKRAGATTKQVKELQENVKNLTSEVTRLRERCRAKETKADRFTAAETERRRITQAMQEKELLCRDLQDLLTRAERKLEDYEASGAEPRAKTTQLDKEHLRIRLQNEVKARQQLEKKVGVYEAELATLRVMDGAAARSRSEPPPPRGRKAVPRQGRTVGRSRPKADDAEAAEAARMKEQHAAMTKELVAAQNAKERAVMQVAELRTALEAQKHDVAQQLRAAQRREEAAQKRVAEKEDLLSKNSQDFVKKTGEVDATKRDAAEAKLMVARMDAELKATRKELKRAADGASGADESCRRLADEKHELEKEVSQLRAQLDQSAKATKVGRQENEQELRKKQLAWERDRAELLQQNAKMRLREQELAAEARMHEDSAAQLKSQLTRAQSDSKRGAADAHKYEEASQQLGALQSKYATLKKQHDVLRDDRSLSQKDAIIEKLTMRLKEADETADMLRKTNANLMKRME